MRRRGFGLIALAALVAAGTLFAAGCGDDDSSSGSTTPEATQKFTIALDWTPNTNHAGIYVAQDRGYFAEEGLELEILPYSGANTDVLVAQGKADLGVSFVPQLLVSRASGVEVKAVAAIMSENAESLAVLGDSKFATPKDLATGTTYGGFGLPSEAPTWSAVIKADGATEVDFKNVTLNTAAYEALYAKKIDWSAIFDAWEGIEAKQRGITLRTFPISEYLGEAGNYPSTIFVASDKAIANDPEKLEKGLAALSKGYTYAAENPAESAKILIAADPALGEATELVNASAAYLAPIYVGASGQWGEFKEESFSGLGAILAEAGALKDASGTAVTPTDYAQFYTNDLLPSR
jgi:ABC-type nitrate/sulfonate/bicarbonate transport system substrate-binding protein